MFLYHLCCIFRSPSGGGGRGGGGGARGGGGGGRGGGGGGRSGIAAGFSANQFQQQQETPLSLRYGNSSLYRVLIKVK